MISSDQIDPSIDLTLGNFIDAAPLFSNDTKQFIGITPYPTTPIAVRPMPPLAYPQSKQSSSAFINSNGLTSSQSAVNNNNSRPYNNNNNNNTAINNVNSYQQKSSSSTATLLLAPPPQSRANIGNSSNSASTNNNINNTFVRPSDNKPLINGRSGYPTAPQLNNKHEVNICLLSRFSERLFRAASFIAPRFTAKFVFLVITRSAGTLIMCSWVLVSSKRVNRCVIS